MTKLLPRIVSLLLALALAGAVTGCGGSDDKDGKAGSGSSSTTSSPGGGSSSGGGAQFDAQDKKLPKDYPSDDVPLTDGKVLYSLGGDITGSGGKGWTVRVGTTTKSAPTAITAAISKLKSAGFTQQGKTVVQRNTRGKASLANLKDDTYSVHLVASNLGGKDAVVIYTVTKG